MIDLPWVVLFLLVLSSSTGRSALRRLSALWFSARLAWWTASAAHGGQRRYRDSAGRRWRQTRPSSASPKQRRRWACRRDCARAARGSTDATRGPDPACLRRWHASAVRGGCSDLFLQSAMLTVGAVLVIDGKASGGHHPRRIDPRGPRAGADRPGDRDQARALRRARRVEAHRPSARQLPTHRAEDRGRARIARRRDRVRDIWVTPPGCRPAVLNGISLTISPGHALAVVGPSAIGQDFARAALLGSMAARAGRGPPRRSDARAVGTGRCSGGISATSRRASSWSRGRSPRILPGSIRKRPRIR